MFKIIKDGNHLAIVGKPTWVRMQENGNFGLTDKDNAHGVALDGKVFHVHGLPEIEGADSVSVIEVDDGQYFTAMQPLMPHEDNTDPETSPANKMKLLTDALSVLEKPDLPDRPGFKWKLNYTWGDSGYVWVEVEDPDAPGTQKNPITFEPGMAVKVNYWYTDGTTAKVCVQNGTPESFDDTDFFEVL